MPGEKNHGELARRRVFKSGPAEEAIERGGGGGGHERGNSPPLVRGVWGSPPRTFLSAFNVFYAFGTTFYSFWSQRYFLSREKPNAGQNCLQTVTCCFF